MANFNSTIALFTGYVLKRGVHPNQLTMSGGDKKFIELARRWPEDLPPLHIVTAPCGERLLQSEGVAATVRCLPHTPAEGLGIIPSYLTRLLTSATILPPLLSATLIYSSSDTLPAIAAPFVAKVLRRKPRWIACLYHLIPPPEQRPGKRAWNRLSYLAQRLALTLLRRADLIVVDNSALRDDLAHLGFDRENIFVCSMGVSLPAPTPPVDLQDYDACFLGRVHPAKGIFDLIEIWDAVRRMRPVARCAVIGDDSDLKGPIADEIARRGLEKHLDFLGFLPQREVSETFARSKLFVLPSREEGWGIAIAEAMAAGLPAILYDLPAFRNLYTSGVEKIPCFSTAAYAHAIVRLLEDPSRRESLSREAKLLSATFSWDETTGREFDCLRALLH